MSNVQDTGTHEVLLKLAEDLEVQAAERDRYTKDAEIQADKFAATARTHRDAAARLRAQAAEIRALVEMAKIAESAVTLRPSEDREGAECRNCRTAITLDHDGKWVHLFSGLKDCTPDLAPSCIAEPMEVPDGD